MRCPVDTLNLSIELLRQWMAKFGICITEMYWLATSTKEIYEKGRTLTLQPKDGFACRMAGSVNHPPYHTLLKKSI